jgi:phage tail sheath gpL-like
VAAYAVDLVRQLWEPLALTKEADAAVAGIRAEIDGTNPGRINLLIPDVHAAGLRIIAGRVQWSFYAPATAA